MQYKVKAILIVIVLEGDQIKAQGNWIRSAGHKHLSCSMSFQQSMTPTITYYSRTICVVRNR